MNVDFLTIASFFSSTNDSKIRLNKTNGKNGTIFLDALNDPSEIKGALNGGNWNYSHHNEFGQSKTVFQFAKVSKRKNEWVLFMAERVIESDGTKDGVGYKWEIDHDYDDLLGKLVIEYKVKRGESTLTQGAKKILDESSKVIILSESLLTDKALEICKTDSVNL